MLGAQLQSAARVDHLMAKIKCKRKSIYDLVTVSARCNQHTCNTNISHVREHR